MLIILLKLATYLYKCVVLSDPVSRNKRFYSLASLSHDIFKQHCLIEYILLQHSAIGYNGQLPNAYMVCYQECNLCHHQQQNCIPVKRKLIK